MDRSLYFQLHELTPESREDTLAAVRAQLPAILQDQKAVKMLTIGLFMSIWHSDKPRNQAALCTAIADWVPSLPPDQAKAFLESMAGRLAREWPQIDYWRISKYMQFVRLLLERALARFKGDSWLFEWLVEKVVLRDDEMASHSLDILVESMAATGTLAVAPLACFKAVFTKPMLELQRKVLEKVFTGLANAYPEHRQAAGQLLLEFGKERAVRESIRREVYTLGKWMVSEYGSLQEYAAREVREIQEKAEPRAKKIKKGRLPPKKNAA